MACRIIKRLMECVSAQSYIRGANIHQAMDRIARIIQSMQEQIEEFYHVLENVKDGEQGPAGPQGPKGDKGDSGSSNLYIQCHSDTEWDSRFGTVEVESTFAEIDSAIKNNINVILCVKVKQSEAYCNWLLYLSTIFNNEDDTERFYVFSGFPEFYMSQGNMRFLLQITNDTDMDKVPVHYITYKIEN